MGFLEKGNQLYKTLIVYAPLNIQELSQHVINENCSLTV